MKRFSFVFAVILILTLCTLRSAPCATVNFTASWTAPTTNADGTPLTDLAGYNLYRTDGARTKLNSSLITTTSFPFSLNLLASDPYVCLHRGGHEQQRIGGQQRGDLCIHASGYDAAGCAEEPADPKAVRSVMRKIAFGILILMIVSAVLAEVPPVKGAKLVGTFVKGKIMDYQDGTYTVGIFFHGYSTTELVLYLSTSPDNPNIISREVYLAKTATAKYWWQDFETFNLYFVPLSGNLIEVWIFP